MRPDASLCPEDIKESLELYVEKRCKPGSFLMAVLRNDLRNAIGRADDGCLSALPHIVAYLYNRVRGDCWGSREKVEAWLNGGGDE